MLIYEVNLYVDGDAAEEMAVWMKDHIREMLPSTGLWGRRGIFVILKPGGNAGAFITRSIAGST